MERAHADRHLNQQPDLSVLDEDLRARIAVVNQRIVFEGHEEARPTFNSLAIESMSWRVPGLAKRFAFFNDEVLLTAPLRPADVFRGESPVLRGRWVDRAALAVEAAIPDTRAWIGRAIGLQRAA